MDENKSITYDDLIQTRNTQILKSIVPFLDVPTQKPLAMLIQLWNGKMPQQLSPDRRTAWLPVLCLPVPNGGMQCLVQSVNIVPQKNRK